MGQTLSGKVALVTGGSRGIGAAIVRRLATDGATVVFTYAASPGSANDLAREIEATGAQVLAIHADSAQPAAVQAAVAETVACGESDCSPRFAGTPPTDVHVDGRRCNVF